jgi:hypothetical protein
MGRRISYGTHSQGFTLGYFRYLPTGGGTTVGLPQRQKNQFLRTTRVHGIALCGDVVLPEGEDENSLGWSAAQPEVTIVAFHHRPVGPA